MTEHKAYDRLVSDLELLHAQSLDRAEPGQQDLRMEFEQRLMELANSEGRLGAFRGSEAKLNRAFFGGPRTWLAAAASVAVVGVLGWSLVNRHRVRVEASPEPLRSSEKVLPASLAGGAASRAVADPCAAHIRATGDQPLIDDFEDGNPLISSFESRVGLWGLYKDTDSPGANMPITPTLRPQPTRGNRYALHAVSGELRNWGATVQFAFQPSCYDATQYGGLSFSAKGPGRVYAGAHEVRVVPVEWGGTCTRDCYDTHQKKVDLGVSWQSYSLKWSELHQRGYNTPALDPARIHSIGFLIQPGDTPFDIWIDDVKFIAR